MQKTEKDSESAADVASAVTSTCCKTLGLHDFSAVWVVCDREAKKVRFFHIEGFVFVLQIFEMVQVHGIVNAVAPGE